MLVKGLLLINSKIVICYLSDKPKILLVWMACVPLSIHSKAGQMLVHNCGRQQAGFRNHCIGHSHQAKCSHRQLCTGSFDILPALKDRDKRCRFLSQPRAAG